jgi:acyl-CoA thioester hydrolase
MKKHETPIQMRFADTDALGHINNVSYIAYSETARLAFLRVLGGPVRSLILAHIAVDFRKQVIFGEDVVIQSWVERIGSTSVTIIQHLMANGVLAAEMNNVVVSFDYATQRATPWRDEARAALTEYLAAQ